MEVVLVGEVLLAFRPWKSAEVLEASEATLSATDAKITCQFSSQAFEIEMIDEG